MELEATRPGGCLRPQRPGPGGHELALAACSGLSHAGPRPRPRPRAGRELDASCPPASMSPPRAQLDGAWRWPHCRPSVCCRKEEKPRSVQFKLWPPSPRHQLASVFETRRQRPPPPEQSEGHAEAASVGLCPAARLGEQPRALRAGAPREPTHEAMFKCLWFFLSKCRAVF